MSKLETNQVDPATGTTLTLGTSGDTVNLGAGVTAGFGKILQVVQTAFNANTLYDPGTNTWGEITEMRTSITPSSTSNKILVMPSICFGLEDDSQPIFKLQRDSTDISIGNTYSGGARQGTFACYPRGGAETNSVMTATFNFLDSPSSTSSVRYELWLNNRGTSAKETRLNAPQSYTSWGDANASGLTSTMTLMEVAG